MTIHTRLGITFEARKLEVITPKTRNIESSIDIGRTNTIDIDKSERQCLEVLYILLECYSKILKWANWHHIKLEKIFTMTSP